MKQFYTIIVTLCILTGFTMQAQNFEFSLTFIGDNAGTGNYQVALVATPSAMINDGITADMGAGFYVPAGLTIGNFVTGDSNIPASDWSSTSMGSNGNGDAFFISRVEAGSMSTNLNGTDAVQLVLFDIIASPNPSSGGITFVENGDPIFDNLFVENYMNINLGSGTTNAYSQNDPGANSIDFATLDVEDQELANTSISIYPNPTSKFINISSNLDINTVELFDLLGKLVLTTEQTNQIRVDQLPAGVYLIKLYSSKGKLTKKVIIE